MDKLKPQALVLAGLNNRVPTVMEFPGLENGIFMEWNFVVCNEMPGKVMKFKTKLKLFQAWKLFGVNKMFWKCVV